MSSDLNWPVALIASALFIWALTEAVQSMRAKNIGTGLAFLLLTVVSIGFTFWADPGYRNLLSFRWKLPSLIPHIYWRYC